MSLVLLLAGIILAAVLVAEGWFLQHILGQQGRLLLRLEELEARAAPQAAPSTAAGAIGLPILHTAQSFPGPASVASNGLPVIANQPSRPVIPNRGDPAPDFSLPDLAGHTMRLSDFRGSLMLVLFWRPSCGFCQRMLPDLKAWEAQPPQGALTLLVVSTDGVQDNQAMGLRSLIVLDQEGMRVGGTFGANGHPDGGHRR